MISATVVSMSARPWRAAQLCFEVGGILEALNAQFGIAVKGFDLTGFYASLYPNIASPQAALANSQTLLASPLLAGPSGSLVLATLRAEPRKAALDRAVNARQNAYVAKYSPTASANITSSATGYYGTDATANPAMLAQLSTLAQTQADRLAATYLATGRGYPPGGTPIVVQNTTSSLTSKTYTSDAANATPNLTTVSTPNVTTTTTGQSDQNQILGPNFSLAGFGSGEFPGPPVLNPSGGDISGSNNNVTASIQEDVHQETSTESGSSKSTETGTEPSTGTAYAVETENIVNTDYTYRVPSIESQAQNLRAQISLNDQQFALLASTQNLSSLPAVFQAELNSIDLGVYQQQVGLLNTLFASSINGTVTGIYKYPGDPVRPGDPVIRIEDSSQLLVVARLVCAGPINIGMMATIKTTLYDATALTPPLKGSIVAVRGAGDDNLWDAVVLCTNPADSGGNLVIPIGYNFDYDDTTVSIG